MKIKNVVLVCLAMAIMLIPIAGCNGSVTYEALELVPEGTNMLAGIKVSEMLRNWQLYSELEGDESTEKPFDDMKEGFADELGIDLNDITNAIIFAQESSMDTMEYTGIILEGNFADKDLINNIEKETGNTFEAEDYGDFILYTDSDTDAAVLPLNNTMIVMGSIKAVKDCIAVINGDLSRETGVVLDTYDDMGDVMLKLAMIIPQEAKESFSEQPEQEMMPVGLEAFEDMQSLGMAADMGTQTLTIKVNIEFSPADSAAKAAESLKTMMDFIAMMSQDEESAELLKGIEITTGGARVYLDYEISLAELSEMAESFEDGTGFPMIPSGPPGMELPDDFEIPGWSDDDFEFPDDFELPEIPED
ncbi:MAG: hypothetical protein JSU58_01215 [Dehalococcoidales bacterium]|nr:MAG: hypothetical protein JSU58_01215 [Dehalococcoidales bacterium]